MPGPVEITLLVIVLGFAVYGGGQLMNKFFDWLAAPAKPEPFHYIYVITIGVVPFYEAATYQSVEVCSPTELNTFTAYSNLDRALRHFTGASDFVILNVLSLGTHRGAIKDVVVNEPIVNEIVEPHGSA